MTELTESKIDELIRHVSYLTTDMGIVCETERSGSTLTIKIIESTIDRLSWALSRYDQYDNMKNTKIDALDFDDWISKRSDAETEIILLARQLVEENKK